MTRRAILAAPLGALAAKRKRWRRRPVGWSSNIFQLLLVVSGPNATGLFVYNGAPAKGSLVAAITAPGVTADPFGNSIPSSGVFNAGTWNASGTLTSHFGVNNSGDTFLVNASGLTVVHERSSDGSEFFYNTSGEGAGNLITSVAPAATTDGPGNTVLAGFASYSNIMNLQITAGGLFFHRLPTDFAGLPKLSASGSNSIGAVVTLDSGNATGATDSQIQLSDSIAVPGLGRRLITLLTDQVVVQSSFANPTTTAALEVDGVIQTTGLNAIIANGNLQTQLGDIIASAGNLLINTIGKGLRVKEGSGAKQGTALLAGGTATVANTNVTAASRIFLTAQDNSSTGALRVSSRVAGTSFTITSSVAGDSGSVAWEIFEPA